MSSVAEDQKCTCSSNPPQKPAKELLAQSQLAGGDAHQQGTGVWETLMGFWYKD